MVLLFIGLHHRFFGQKSRILILTVRHLRTHKIFRKTCIDSLLPQKKHYLLAMADNDVLNGRCNLGINNKQKKKIKKFYFLRHYTPIFGERNGEIAPIVPLYPPLLTRLYNFLSITYSSHILYFNKNI